MKERKNNEMYKLTLTAFYRMKQGRIIVKIFPFISEHSVLPCDSYVIRFRLFTASPSISVWHFYPTNSCFVYRCLYTWKSWWTGISNAQQFPRLIVHKLITTLEFERTIICSFIKFAAGIVVRCISVYSYKTIIYLELNME